MGSTLDMFYSTLLVILGTLAAFCHANTIPDDAIVLFTMTQLQVCSFARFILAMRCANGGWEVSDLGWIWTAALK